MRSPRFIFVLALATVLTAAPASAVLSPASIPAAFEELLQQPSLSNPAMILIDGTSGEVVYEKNAFSQRKPASVMKLLTSAATIQHLDLQSTFNTTISINPDIKTVIIRGALDPWISLDHKTARKMSRASLPFMGFETLKGVKAFNGGSLKNYDVIYSDLYSQDVSNLKSFWAKRGFKPKFKEVTDDEAFMALGEQIVSENSPTVAALVDWILLWSDNLISERLARLSARAAGYPMNSKGVDRVLRDVLIGMQIDDSKLVVADASGLSRKNKITAKMAPSEEAAPAGPTEIELLAEIRRRRPDVVLQASGGISSLDDLVAVKALGCCGWASSCIAWTRAGCRWRRRRASKRCSPACGTGASALRGASANGASQPARSALAASGTPPPSR